MKRELAEKIIKEIGELEYYDVQMEHYRDSWNVIITGKVPYRHMIYVPIQVLEACSNNYKGLSVQNISGRDNYMRIIIM